MAVVVTVMLGVIMSGVEGTQALTCGVDQHHVRARSCSQTLCEAERRDSQQRHTIITAASLLCVKTHCTSLGGEAAWGVHFVWGVRLRTQVWVPTSSCLLAQTLKQPVRN